MAQDYTKTLNLPKTDFPMRANLPQREPEIRKYWEEINLYEEMLKKNEGKPLFVLHDGPPFSNGNIHMGTALNKMLKDFIIKYKSMSGFKAPYIPGWDNHGMPIESAIIKKNKLDRKKMSKSEFRSACHKFAQDFVDIQMASFKSLGVNGDWKHPYKTMDPAFEGREVRVFGEMFKRGYIYKGLKPVYWCPHDETALAEAEIEYATDKCTSIYVKFKVKDDMGKLADVCDLDKTYFVIWTTTTWTLPGNLAIALNPDENYVAAKTDRGEYLIVAEALLENTMKQGEIESYEVVKTMRGREFEFMRASHPFIERDSLIVNADYVTMDSGTGCVHTAPGFGADDYVTCRRYNMDIIVPVDDRGYQTSDAGKFAGMYYEESNAAILADLKESGALFASKEFDHEYPHCWRCKHPIIFRATPQWFCSVDAFKDDAIKACDNVRWLPAWGGDRIKQMIRERADWCISRQRYWGLPIPVFYCEDCGEIVCNDETIDSVSKVFSEKGSNAWFDLDAAELLPAGFKCPKCGKTHFVKETNTLDGWFDSGSSHFRVLDDNPEMKWPADMYLEGADQYRGWFQSSLLTAVGAKGEGAPYKTVLTHGWVVDGEGKAMHKSLGNSVAPETVINKYGSDILRSWAASGDYRVDMRVSDQIFAQLCEVYRKIRNTVRILLANINDFDPDKDSVAISELPEIDKWALTRLNELVKSCRENYDEYEFHNVYHDINNFCTVDMSKLYIDITKDRLYVEKPDSKSRRAGQTVMYTIVRDLTLLFAPLLSHTADEIWRCMPHYATDDVRSAQLNPMPEYRSEFEFADIAERRNKLFDMRDTVMKALEEARAEKLIGKSLDAKIKITVADESEFELLKSFEGELETVFIVSGVTLERGDEYKVEVSAADGKRCDRCWKYSTDGKETEDGFICRRCAKIIEG